MLRYLRIIVCLAVVIATPSAAVAYGDGFETARDGQPGDRTTRAPAGSAEPEKSLPLATKRLAPATAAKATQPAGSSTGSMLLNIFGSLAVVLGLFLAVVWFLRRSAPQGSAQLPTEVFEVLGRAPLAGRQSAQLVRCGNRLLLLSVTPGGAETLAEITEAAEVDRLAGLCQQTRSTSATAAFRNLFSQFADENAAARRKPKPALEAGDA